MVQLSLGWGDATPKRGGVRTTAPDPSGADLPLPGHTQVCVQVIASPGLPGRHSR